MAVVAVVVMIVREYNTAIKKQNDQIAAVRTRTRAGDKSDDGST